MEIFSKKLEKLEFNLKNLEDVRNSQEQAKNEELDIAKKRITEKYAKLNEPINNKIYNTKQSIENYCKEVQMFSTFDSKIIGEVLEHLVTLFEGERYCYQEALHTTTKIEHCVFDRVEVAVEKIVRLVINSNHKREKYDNFTNLTQKINDGQVIVLFNEENDYSDINPNIIFNQVSIRKNDLHSNVYYGKFNYVKEFMDNVINYRINNNIKDISKSELYELLKLFAVEKKNVIEAGYQQRFNQQQEDLKKQLEESTIQYPKELQKILSLTPTDNK